MNTLEKLLKYQDKINEKEYLKNILEWDLRTEAPKDSYEYVMGVISNLEKEILDLKQTKKYKELLTNVLKDKTTNEKVRRYVTKIYDSITKLERIPNDLIIEYRKHLNNTNIIWKTAKENNDYNLFKPYLAKAIEYAKKYYSYINSSLPTYDVMLNEYEKGITSKEIDLLFNELKEYLIPLINEIKSNNKININIKYTSDELMECAKILLEYEGFDYKKGTLGIYPHGFTNKMNYKDVRIAFNDKENPFDFVSTIIHEGGHAIFEQNISENLDKITNLALEDSYALHESQSRFYENILGRNINFLIPIYDKIKRILKLDLSIEEFCQRLNVVHPDLIRTSADEVTYCLHIIIRYEIERDLFNSKISIDDLPEIWNQKMQEYLGVTVTNDSEGLMQDVHWSEGDFGYFPSYLLGTIYDGMFLEAIESDLGSVNEILKSGNIKQITQYLIDNIYVNGGAYSSKEIIKKLCHKDLSVKPIINYFEKKYRNK